VLAAQRVHAGGTTLDKNWRQQRSSRRKAAPTTQKLWSYGT
jgi:hypothetical protein